MDKKSPTVSGLIELSILGMDMVNAYIPEKQSTSDGDES